MNEKKRHNHAADEALVLALAEGLKHAEAGRRAGVSASTVQRRLRDPAFVEDVSRARAAIVAGVRGALTATSARAVQVLNELLDAKSPTVRLGAARGVLDYFLKFQTIEGLAERVEQLERKRYSLEHLPDEVLNRMYRDAVAREVRAGRFPLPRPNTNGLLPARRAAPGMDMKASGGQIEP